MILYCQTMIFYCQTIIFADHRVGHILSDLSRPNEWELVSLAVYCLTFVRHCCVFNSYRIQARSSSPQCDLQVSVPQFSSCFQVSLLIDIKTSADEVKRLEDGLSFFEQVLFYISNDDCYL